MRVHPEGRGCARRHSGSTSRTIRPRSLTTMTEKKSVTRRGFLGTTGVAAGAVLSSGAFPHPAVGGVKGANERLNFAILGPGGRAQAHIGHLLDMKKEGKP